MSEIRFESAYLGASAQVLDNARVFGDAQVSGNARLTF